MPGASLRELFNELVTMSRMRSDRAVVVVASLPRSASKYFHGVLLNVLEDDTPVYHTHGISPRRLAGLENSRTGGKEPTLERYRELIDALASARHTVVFVPFREPIERIYSGFVRNFFKSEALRQHFDAATASFRDPQQLQAQFDDYAHRQFVSQRDWMHNELEQVFGVQWSDWASPAASGYSICVRGNSRFVLLRTDRLDSLLETELFDRFPVREQRRFKFENGRAVLKYGPGRRNSAAERGDAVLARAFQSGFLPRPELIQAIYDLPIVKHVYSDAEIAALRDSWRRVNGA